MRGAITLGLKRFSVYRWPARKWIRERQHYHDVATGVKTAGGEKTISVLCSMPECTAYSSAFDNVLTTGHIFKVRRNVRKTEERQIAANATRCLL
jgi:hypothetical protein